MKLSIVVPTYNVEDYLANCLESLLRQDLKPSEYEILVVNDGSTDRSGEIGDSYAERYSNIRVIHQTNAGLSGARNTGLSHATGDYIYFIDSDDYITDNTLGFIIKLMDSHQLDVLGLGVKETEHLDEYTCENFESVAHSTVRIVDGISFIADYNYMNNAWWYVIRRDFLIASELTFPLGRFVEDANFTAGLLLAAKKAAYLPLDFYRYVVRPTSIMRKKSKSHVARLIGDYKKNVFDFHEQISRLDSTDKHPDLGSCRSRLIARKESFVFFGIIKALRNGFTAQEVRDYIYDFETIKAYPIRGFIGPDYRKLQYRLLLPLINNKFVLGLIARIYPS